MSCQVVVIPLKPVDVLSALIVVCLSIYEVIDGSFGLSVIIIQVPLRVLRCRCLMSWCIISEPLDSLCVTNSNVSRCDGLGPNIVDK